MLDIKLGDEAPISLIEPHDGHIACLSLSFHRLARLDFDKLTVYRLVTEERYEIWIYQARLELIEITDVSMQGLRHAGENVDNAIVYDDTVILDWTELLQPKRASRLSVTLGSGATLEVGCVSAQLSLRGRGTYLEDWIGPL